MRRILLHHAFLLILSLFALNISAQDLADIDYSVVTIEIRHHEDGIGGACQEFGDEAYSGYLWSSDNVDGTETQTYGECNNNGDCSTNENVALQSRTNLATTLNFRIDAWEDDSAPRNAFNGDDDCRRNESQSLKLRETAFPSNSAYTSTPTWGSTDNHTYRFNYTWHYSYDGSPSQLTPSTSNQTRGYGGGQIRSWPVQIVGGREYFFSVCGSAGDTRMRLYAPDGYTILADVDDNGPLCGGTDASMSYSACNSGTYFLELSENFRGALSNGGTLNYYYSTAAPGNPAVFGSNSWNVYAYNGRNVNLSGLNYQGFYTQSGLSYNTASRWTNRPSDASGYSGLCVNPDNHTVVSKRQGFSCGVYRIDIPTHDDEYQLWINGVLESFVNGCCGPVNNAWTGYLSGSSTIEMRHADGAGGSNQALTLTNVISTLNGGTIGGIANNSNYCQGSDPGAFTSVTNAFGGTVGAANAPAHTYQWQRATNASFSGATVVAGNTTTYNPPSIASPVDYYYRRRVTDACGNVAYSNVVHITVSSNAVPTATTATGGSCTRYRANWTSVYGNTTYRIDVATDAGFSNIIFNNINVGSATSYDLNVALPGTYYYRVRAVNACGTTSNSNVVSLNATNSTNNDLFRNAIDITSTVATGSTYSTFWNNNGYSEEGGEPRSGDHRNTGWYKFTTPPGGMTSITCVISENGGNNTSVGLYRSNGTVCPFGGLSEIDYDRSCASSSSTAEENCLPGNTTYYVQVGTADNFAACIGGNSTGGYNITIDPGPPGAPTNVCTAEQVGSGNLGLNANVVTSTFSNICGNPNYFYFTTGATVPSEFIFDFINVNEFGTFEGLEGEVYKLNSGSLCSSPSYSSVGSWDPAACGVEADSDPFCLDPNSTYIIQVREENDGACGGDGGNFQVRIRSNNILKAPTQICNAIRVGSSDIGSNQTETTSTYSNHCGDPNWFYFTTPANVASEYFIRFNNINEFGALEGLEGEILRLNSGTLCSSPSYTSVGSWDPALCGVEEEGGGFCLEPSSTYLIRVTEENDGTCGGDGGHFQVRVRTNGNVKAPDEICEADALGTIGTIGYNGYAITADYVNVCNTVAGTDPSFDETLNNTSWFYFNTTAINNDKRITITVEQRTPGGINSLSPEFRLYKSSNGTCSGSLTPVGGTIDPISGDAEETYDCLEANTRYYIMIDGDDCVTCDVTGGFRIEIDAEGIKDFNNNDVCESYDLGTNGLGGPTVDPNETNEYDRQGTEFNNLCYDDEGGEPNAGAGDRTAWFEFTTGPTPAKTIRVEAYDDNNLCGGVSIFDASPRVYTLNGSCTNAANLVLVTDGGGGAGCPTSCVEFDCPLPNTTYYVQIRQGALSTCNEGDWKLRVISEDPAAANDLICDAIAVGDGLIELNDSENTPTSNTINNYCGTANEGTTISDPGSWDGRNQTVWFYIDTDPAYDGTKLNFKVDNNGFGGDNINAEIAVYEASTKGCGATLTPLGDDSPGTSFEAEVDVYCPKPDTRYYILVDNSATIALPQEGFLRVIVEDDNNPEPIGGLAANNVCDVSSNLPTDGTVFTFNNRCADTQGSEVVWPDGSTTIEKTIWHRFIGPSGPNTGIEIETDHGQTDFDTELTLYYSPDGTCDMAQFLPIAYADDGLLGALDPEASLEEECVIPGGVYFIQVDGHDGDDWGAYGISISAVSGTPPPVNDNLCDAIDIGAALGDAALSLGDNWNYTTAQGSAQNNCALTQTNEPNVSGGRTVWYSFTTDATVSNLGVEVSLDASGIDDEDFWAFGFAVTARAYTLSGSCNNTDLSNLTELTNEEGVNIDPSDRLYICLAPSTTYYIQIDGNFAANIATLNFDQAGIFDVQLDNEIAPATHNDVCATAIALPVNGSSATFTNRCTDTEAGEVVWPDGSTTIEKTVWHSFVAPAAPNNGVEISTNNGGTNFDTELTLYYSPDGSCNMTQFLPIAYDDDRFGLLAPEAVISEECLIPGGTYYIQVDGHDADDNGSYEISLTAIAGTPPPVNDNICDAIDIGAAVGDALLSSGDTWNYTTAQGSAQNNCASTQTNEPNISGGNTVWYTFTTAANATNMGAELYIDGSGVDDEDFFAFGFAVTARVYSMSGSCSNLDLSNLTELLETDVDLLDPSDRNYLCLDPNTTYYVQIDGNFAANIATFNFDQAGIFEIDMVDNGITREGPLRDEPCLAGVNVLPTDGSTNIYNNYCATASPGEPDVDETGIGIPFVDPSTTTWHSFVGPGYPNNGIIISTDHPATDFDTEIALWYSLDGSCDTSKFVQVDYDDDVTLLVNLNSELQYSCLIEGGIYYIQVDGNDVEDQGTYEISVEAIGGVEPPVNDFICNALDVATLVGDGDGVLTLGENWVFNPVADNNQNDNNCAGTQNNEPLPSTIVNHAGKTVWYKFTTGADISSIGRLLSVDGTGVDAENALIGNSFSVVTNVYTMSGACDDTDLGNLTLVDNYDGAIGIDPDISDRSVICFEPNTTYYVQIDGNIPLNIATLNWDFAGRFSVEVEDNGITRALNDDICDATPFGPLTTSTITLSNQKNYCATDEASEPNTDGNDETVWYRFTTGSQVARSYRIMADSTTNDNPCILPPFEFIDVTLYEDPTPANCNNWDLIEIDNVEGELAWSTDFPLDILRSRIDRVACLKPNTTYVLQVDVLDSPGCDDYRDFGIRIEPDGLLPATNDSICDAIYLGVVPDGDTTVRFFANNYCSDTEVGEPDPEFTTGGSGVDWVLNNTVYFTFTPPSSGMVEFEFISGANAGDDLDFQVAIYEPFDSNGSCEQGMILLAAGDDQFGLDIPYFSIDWRDRMNIVCSQNGLRAYCLDPDRLYYIQVDTRGVTTTEVLEDQHRGDFSIRMRDLEAEVYAATNDYICDALWIPDLVPTYTCNTQTFTNIPPVDGSWVGESVEQTNYCATAKREPYNSEFTVNKSVWFKFNAPPSGNVDIRLESEPFDTLDRNDNVDLQVAVYRADNIIKYDNPDSTCTFDVLEERKLQFDDPVNIAFHPIFYQGVFALKNEWVDTVKCLIPGETYYVMVDGNNAFTCGLLDLEGFFSIGIKDNQTVPPSINDSICEAVSLPAFAPNAPGTVITASDHNPICNPYGAVDYYNNTCATIEANELPGQDADADNFDADNSLWFEFIAPNSGRVEVRGLSQNIDRISLQLAVYAYDDASENCANPLVHIADNWQYDPTGILSADEDLVVSCLIPGNRYLIQVDGGNPTGTFATEFAELGVFDLEIEVLAPFNEVDANDDICFAKNLGGTTLINGETATLTGESNRCATEELDEPNTSQLSGYNAQFVLDYDETVWYYFTTGANPGEVTIEVFNNDFRLNFGSDNWPGFSAGINLYEANGTACTFDDLLQVADEPSTDAIIFFEETMTVNCLKPNTRYYIQVDGWDLGLDINVPGFGNIYAAIDQGDFDISVSMANGSSAPYNDDICNVANLGDVSFGTPASLTNQTNSCAGIEIDELNVDLNVGDIRDIAYDETVWYKFRTAADVGPINIFVDNFGDLANLSAVVYKYQGTDINGNMSCTDGSPTNWNELLEVEASSFVNTGIFDVNLTINCLEPSTWYYIQVDGWDNVLDLDQGTFNITVTDNGPANAYPNNDLFCDAIVLTSPSGAGIQSIVFGETTGPIAGNNICTTEELGEPFTSQDSVVTNNDYDETVWYAFQSDAAPGEVEITLTRTSGGVNFGPAFRVYESISNTAPVSAGGACVPFSDLEFIGGNENVVSGAIGTVTELYTCIRPSHWYYIQVDGADIPLFEDWGNFTIEIEDMGVLLTYTNNDDLENAIRLDGDIALAGINDLPTPGTGVWRIDDNNLCASEELNEPNTSQITDVTDNDYDETVWYYFTTNNIGPATLRIEADQQAGDAIDLNACLYQSTRPKNASATNFGQLINLECTTNNNGNLVMEAYCLLPNTRYYIQVDGNDSGDDIGRFDIRVLSDAVAQGPNHDLICEAGFLGNPSGGSVSTPLWSNASNDVSDGVNPGRGNNQCATRNILEPNSTAGHKTVWYSFVAPASGDVDITATSNNSIDIEMNLYYSGTTPISCVNEEFGDLLYIDGTDGNFLSNNAEFDDMTCLIRGHYYYLQVMGANSGNDDDGLFTLTITDNQPSYSIPTGDDPCNATPIGVGTESCQITYGTGSWAPNTYNYQDNSMTVSMYQEGCETDFCNRDRWFVVDMSDPDILTGNIFIEGDDDYAQSAFNLNSEIVIAAYKAIGGDCNNLVQIACDGGNSGLLGLDDASLYVPETAYDPGDVIYIQVFNAEDNQNNEEFGLCVSDRCGFLTCDAAAATIMEYNVEYCFDMEGAGDLGLDYPGCLENSDTTNTVYFAFQTGDCGGLDGSAVNLFIDADIRGRFAWSIFQDATPCDGQPDELIDCQFYTTDESQCCGNIGTDIFGLDPNTTYYLMLQSESDYNGNDDDGVVMVRQICGGLDFAYAAANTTTTTDEYCWDGEWRHYYDGEDIIFSMRSQAERLTGMPENYEGEISITVDPFYTESSVAGVAGSWTMKRYWNYNFTTNSSDITYPAEVRFYYLDEEKNEIITAAQQFAAQYGLLYEPFEWFKSADGVDFNPILHVTPPVVIADWSETAQFTPNQFDPNGGDYAQDHDEDPTNEWCNGVQYVEIIGLTGFSGGTGATGASPTVQSPLPVEWLSFIGWNDGDVNELEWVTATEINNEMFVIERSDDAINFTEIGTVAGSGTTSEEQQYNFTDVSPIIGTNYYRLKQVDFDGSFEYSSIIVVEVEASLAKNAIVKIHPNPTNMLLNIQLQAASNTQFEMRVIDITGRLMDGNVIEASEGLNSPFAIDVERYPSGVYILSFIDQNTGERLEAKFVKE